MPFLSLQLIYNERDKINRIKLQNWLQNGYRIVAVFRFCNRREGLKDKKSAVTKL